MNKRFIDSKGFAILFWGLFIILLFIGCYYVNLVMFGFFIGYLVIGEGKNEK